jgi:prevent-host-death family protein
MLLKNISQAKTELSALIEFVQKGGEVLIGKAGKPVARLVPYEGVAKPRVPGYFAGQIKIGDDFDAPLPAEILKGFGITGKKRRR